VSRNFDDSRIGVTGGLSVNNAVTKGEFILCFEKSAPEAIFQLVIGHESIKERLQLAQWN
jgi:hypothetical protein